MHNLFLCTYPNCKLNDNTNKWWNKYIVSLHNANLAQIDGLAQDCSNSNALAMELLQSYANISQDCSKSSVLAMELLQFNAQP